MGKHCSAYKCSNSKAKYPSMSFHRFPLQNAELLEKWVSAVKRHFQLIKPPLVRVDKFTFKPSKYSSLCSDHFKLEDFQIRPGAEKRLLNSSAVPSVFDDSSNKKVMRSCWVVGCKTNEISKNARLLKFPTDIASRRRWSLRIGRYDASGKLIVANNSTRICSRHFKPTQFARTNEATPPRLRPKAEPTIFLRLTKRKIAADSTSTMSVLDHSYSAAAVLPAKIPRKGIPHTEIPHKGIPRTEIPRTEIPRKGHVRVLYDIRRQAGYRRKPDGEIERPETETGLANMQVKNTKTESRGAKDTASHMAEPITMPLMAFARTLSLCQAPSKLKQAGIQQTSIPLLDHAEPPRSSDSTDLNDNCDRNEKLFAESTEERETLVSNSKVESCKDREIRHLKEKVALLLMVNKKLVDRMEEMKSKTKALLLSEQIEASVLLSSLKKALLKK